MRRQGSGTRPLWYDAPHRLSRRGVNVERQGLRLGEGRGHLASAIPFEDSRCATRPARMFSSTPKNPRSAKSHSVEAFRLAQVHSTHRARPPARKLHITNAQAAQSPLLRPNGLAVHSARGNALGNWPNLQLQGLKARPFRPYETREDSNGRPVEACVTWVVDDQNLQPWLDEWPALRAAGGRFPLAHGIQANTPPSPCHKNLAAQASAPSSLDLELESRL